MEKIRKKFFKNYSAMYVSPVGLTCGLSSVVAGRKMQRWMYHDVGTTLFFFFFDRCCVIFHFSLKQFWRMIKDIYYPHVDFFSFCFFCCEGWKGFLGIVKLDGGKRSFEECCLLEYWRAVMWVLGMISGSCL